MVEKDCNITMTKLQEDKYMKQIIPFTKDITFKNTIGELVSI